MRWRRWWPHWHRPCWTVRREAAGALVIVALFLPLGGGGIAKSGGGTSPLLIAGYDLSWNPIDGGGETFSHGGTFTLGGTGGQHDAGLMTADPYVLGGGFWGGGEVFGAGYGVYLPVVVR